MKTNQLFPYQVLTEDLELVAEQSTVDGTAAPAGLLAAQHTINLSALSAGWRRVSIEMRVDLPAVIDEPAADDLQVVLDVNCPATNLRFGVPLATTPRTGRYVGTLELEPGVLARKAILRAVASATIDGITHRYLGESLTWSIWISQPESPLFNGDLEVRWASFKDEEEKPPQLDHAFEDHPYYIDIQPDPPIIWLNEDTEDLRRLFGGDSRLGPAEKAVRDGYYHAIASAGWIAMFNASLGAVRTSETDPDSEVRWPEVDWQRQVLQTLLPKIYPDLDLDSGLTSAYTDDQDADGARFLQARAAAAVNGLLRGRQKLVRAIKSLEEK